MVEVFLSAFKYAAAVGVLSCLVSESQIMSPLRTWIDSMSKNWLTEKLSALVLCPICLSFWFAAPALSQGWDFYFLVVAASNAWMLLILKVYESLEATGD